MSPTIKQFQRLKPDQLLDHLCKTDLTVMMKCWNKCKNNQKVNTDVDADASFNWIQFEKSPHCLDRHPSIQYGCPYNLQQKCFWLLVGLDNKTIVIYIYQKITFPRYRYETWSIGFSIDGILPCFDRLYELPMTIGVASSLRNAESITCWNRAKVAHRE